MRRWSRLLAASFVIVFLAAPGLVIAAGADGGGRRGAAASQAEASVQQIPRSLHGVVVTWREGRLMRVGHAHVGTGVGTVEGDEKGRFTIPASIRTNRVSVVAAGYEVLREETASDFVVAFMKPLVVRAIYLPQDMLKDPSMLAWATGLAREGAITALVVDVKDEGGAVLPLVANETARDLDAVRSTFTDVEGFLQDLGELGIYRIARVVTFLDSRLAVGRPATALRSFSGEIFRDGLGLAWTNPFSDLARRHNIEIGVNAARFFEEVQYDYVRLPTEGGMELRARVTVAERSAIIAQFAAEAAPALHAAGAALAFDTFGLTTIVPHDDGIGQVLEELAPHLDYFSPMVYPSTWTTGWFGLEYPPADPFTVVLSSVSAAVSRLAGYESIIVRPWLQDFHDYGEQKLFYGAREVQAQIDAAAQAGGEGFMLWDPSLQYQLELLRELP